MRLLFAILLAVLSLLTGCGPATAGPPSFSPTVAAGNTTGWSELAAIDFTALDSTTWTSTDEGTTPTVNGVTFDISSLSTGTATVGGGSGLATTDTTALIGARYGVDLSSKHQVLGVVFAIGNEDGVGGGYGIADDFADNAWRVLRTSTTVVAVTRRSTSGITLESATLNDGTITAAAFICAQMETHMYYRTDAITTSALPDPPTLDAAGDWTFLDKVARDTDDTTWGLGATDGAAWVFTNGSADVVLDATAVYQWNGPAD